MTDPRWRKSSRSGTSTDCVELHPDGAVRDSKNPDGPVLTFEGRAALAALVGLVRG